MVVMLTIEDYVILPLCACFGIVGVSLTGFGMAILYVLIWQAASVIGYEGDLKYAIFIQAIALMSVQPILLYRTEIRKYANRRVLAYFIPITIISTPLGQWTSSHVPTVMIQRIAGVLVTILAVWEVYQHRDLCLGRRGEGAASVHEPPEICADGSDGLGSFRTRSIDGNSDSFAIRKAQPDVETPLPEDSSTSQTDHSTGGKPTTRDFGTQTVCHVGTQTDLSELERLSNSWQQRLEEFLDGGDADSPKLSYRAIWITLLAGGASGFLGGLSGIRGPPIIAYFLHPPIPFEKQTQRATAVCITFANVSSRMLYYVSDIFRQESFIAASDWGLYLAVILASIWGCFVGSELFEMVKDSRNMIRAVLSVFLLLCGFSLLLSSFFGV